MPKFKKIKELNLKIKVKKCILLVYREISYGYKLYNPVIKKVIMSRDVKFDKEQEWNGIIKINHKS